MQHPQLNLGLLGCSEQQRSQVRNHLAHNGMQAIEDATQDQPASHPVWQITDFREANALLVNTEHAHIDNDQVLRFYSHPDHPSVVGVRPAELTLPYAVCGELSPAIENIIPSSSPRVALSDERSIVHALQYFEAALRPLRCLYALSHMLVERREELDNKHTFHLMRNAMLDVVIDVPQRRVMLRDGLRPVDLDDAAWEPRPPSANHLPQGFAVWMMEEVAWVHAMHCRQPDLPARYMRKLLYLRRTPRVRASMIYPRHAELIEVLGQEPCTYEQLATLLPERRAQLQRDLYALYVCRAITTNADGAFQSDSGSGSHPASAPGMHPGSELRFHLATAPAPLSK
jgi:hypothetical protein